MKGSCFVRPRDETQLSKSAAVMIADAAGNIALCSRQENQCRQKNKEARSPLERIVKPQPPVVKRLGGDLIPNGRLRPVDVLVVVSLTYL